MQDLGHPYADGEPVYDVTFENVQAGERTSHLFRLANYNDALVVGTGDLSELALGWCTYGVGDQMSHYNVNASVPKTLIQHLIRWSIATDQFGDSASKILQSILETEISPELIPSDDDDSSQPAQSTQAKIGPYELQDFHLYYTSRFGFRPSKVAFLSHHAWGDRDHGEWPDFMAPESRNQYDLGHNQTAGSRSFSIASSRSASSNARPCPTVPKSAPAARFRHAAIGVRRAIRRPTSGWRNCGRMCRTDRACRFEGYLLQASEMVSEVAPQTGITLYSNRRVRI